MEYLFLVFAVKETGRLLLKMIFRDRSLCDPPTNSCAENIKKVNKKLKQQNKKGKYSYFEIQKIIINSLIVITI